MKNENKKVGAERNRTFRIYNLDLLDFKKLTSDFWEMPVIKNDGLIPERLVGFNYAKTSSDRAAGIHFFLDDYQFERVWNKPDRYLETLSRFDCILSPDFSLYMDMPMPMKIWNVYRSRAIGAYYQSQGLKVIPTVSWAEPMTYRFCFKGIPKKSIVAVSTVGVARNKKAAGVWKDGMSEMIEQIEPSAILIYGKPIEFDLGDIDIRYFQNEVTKNWKHKPKGNII